METHSRIPCTVALLTHNNANTLPRALASAKDFQELIVCDGNSSDDTLAIAARAGARIIAQDTQYLDPTGRIQDFAGIRNQTLRAATCPWFLFLDSDEELSPELVNEIRAITQQAPAAYHVLRKYVWKGTLIDHSITYPSYQMRLFHTDVAEAFIKPIHERIKLREGVIPQRTQAFMYVPLPERAQELQERWRRYIALEVSRRPPLSLRKWLRVCAREGAVAVLYALRLIRIQLFRRGTKLPLSFEWARIRYQFDLISALRGTIR